MLQIMSIFNLFPGHLAEETRNSSFWLMKAPRYGPFLHGEWRQLFLLFPVLDREMREGSSTDASIDVTLLLHGTGVLVRE